MAKRHFLDRRLPVAFCSIAFREQPLETLIAPLAEIGYDAIEVFGGHVLNQSEAELDQLKKKADAVAIALPMVSPYFILTRGEAEYRQTLDTAKQTIQAARRLGAEKVRVFTDVASTGLASAAATAENWGQAVSGLEQITQMAPDLEFVIETHENTLADTVASTLKLLKHVGAPNLYVNFQPIRPFLDAGLLDAYDQLLPHIRHIHLHQLNGDSQPGWIETPGLLDMPRFMNHVEASGYRGSVAVEYCWAGTTWPRVRSAHDFVRGMLVA